VAFLLEIRTKESASFSRKLIQARFTLRLFESGPSGSIGILSERKTMRKLGEIEEGRRYPWIFKSGTISH